MLKAQVFLIITALGTSSVFSQENISVLDKIQEKIGTAYNQSFAGDTSALSSLVNQLALSKNNSDEHYLIYWQAFANYKFAISRINQDKKTAENKTAAAIQLLDTLSNKNAEDYVLLGSLTSFNLNFKPGETAILSEKARRYYQKALELDKNNLRAYFSIGRTDYYRPKQYGGGEIAEANFLKALSIPVKSDQSPYAPTWGKMETYELLVTFYIREERKGDAIIYCKKGLQEFPGSSALKENLKTLAL